MKTADQLALAPDVIREIRGLTLWQPMAQMIARGVKTIENRQWPPWKGVTHLAIHAGKHYHLPHEIQIREQLGIDVPGVNAVPYSAVIATCRIAGHVLHSDSPWFSGPFGWVLEDIRALDEPIPCAGALGLWRLPEHVGRALQGRW